MDRPRITLLGRRALRARGRPVRGVVLSVRTLWWIKVNTKPVRRHMADGARFPQDVYRRFHCFFLRLQKNKPYGKLS